MKCCVCGKKISSNYAPKDCTGNYCVKCALETQSKERLAREFMIAQKEIQILYHLLGNAYLKLGSKSMPSEEWYKQSAEQKLDEEIKEGTV